MAMYDKDWGYVLSSKPQTLRQCLNFYRCHSTSTNQQAGDEIGRENLEYIYTSSVCGSGDFSVSLQCKNTRASSFYHCFTILRLRKCGILCSHECGIIFTRYLTIYVHMNVELFLHAFLNIYGGEKQVC